MGEKAAKKPLMAEVKDSAKITLCLFVFLFVCFGEVQYLEDSASQIGMGRD